jgi:hypothetical protein
VKARKGILLLACTMALALGFTASANASPAWKFNGSEIASTEVLIGAAANSSMTIPGVTTECAHFLYNMHIWDSAGKGKGELVEMPLFECTTKTAGCFVSSIEAKKLPWPSHLLSAWGNNYLIIENVDVEVLYSGSSCAYAGIPMTVSGSAGGIINNSTESATFDNETMWATGTGLWTGFTWVEWNGYFPSEAFQTHREQSLSVS